VLLGAVMALCFAYQFTVLLPHAGIGWQAHIGGLVGGVAAGWVFRERRAAAPRAPKSGLRTAPGKAITRSHGEGPRSELHRQIDELGL
jgi:hypothetical protein